MSVSASLPLGPRRLDTLDEPLASMAQRRDPHARREQVSLRVVLGVLVLLGCAVFFQFVPWLVLAAWFAALARPLHRRLAKVLRGSHRAASLVTFLLLLALVAPLVLLGASLVDDARQLWEQLMESRSGRAALETLVTNGTPARRMRLDLPTILPMLESHSAQAFTLVDGLAGVALGLFVFFTAAYVFMVDGTRAMSWFSRNLPLADRHIDRFAASFLETGRGLGVSVLLTGVLQAVLATIIYVALGVPRPLVLGVLTLLVSIIPSVGTALVWVPLTIGLALSGRTTEAIVLGALGTVVISGVDNLTRPLFARWGQLDLHSLVVLLAMLGGLAIFGGWGLFLGPLAVRWLLEALRIAREEGALG